MRIVVIIPNAEWQSTAGVRIRYERIRPWIEAEGHSFTLQPIDEAMAASERAGDIYLISKCHDVRSQLLTRQLRAEGCAVGIDFFDDYYSQKQDAAFMHLRAWFRMMTAQVDFGLCSTPNMRDRLARLVPDLPLLVMNDPAIGWDDTALAEGLRAVAQRTRASKVLDIGWFGIGDNPYFSLGLEDLHAFSGQLLQIRARGYQPRLRILTNRRALDTRRLEMIARLPVPSLVEEWSEEAETALIADSLFCFLPVNGQEFSTVKSLNRAVSVLAGGSQVLSTGFPLYDTLAPFIYRDLGELLDHLDADTLRVRPQTLPDLGALMEQIGSAQVEAKRLTAFLETLPRPRPHDWPGQKPVIVLQGSRPQGEIHKQVQRQGYLSAASPRTTAKLAFDLSARSDPDGRFVDVVLRDRSVSRLAENWRGRVAKVSPPAGGDPAPTLRLTQDDLPGLRPMLRVSAPRRELEEQSRYRPDMALMAEIITLIFDRPHLFLSEANSPYWSPEIEAQRSDRAHV
ncbi:hypothetical protein JI664_04050 [Rhodobacter sp. NTK016B]|uniref:hypothetical protein n=1 Tax=Rhodobacter sp. NTK016B TaxID=2759676 RepID=UPI001A8FE96F|nr:hypothetical protein [Rhodobacter sp. NTK016B]MBN8291131.1 hypothetical protein [Rhodobacter sp. NTK016B]